MAGRVPAAPAPKATQSAKAAPPPPSGKGAAVMANAVSKNVPAALQKAPVKTPAPAKVLGPNGPKGAATQANAIAKNVTPYQNTAASKAATAAATKASQRRADQREAATQRKVADQAKKKPAKTVSAPKVVAKPPAKKIVKKPTSGSLPPKAQAEVSAEPETSSGDSSVPAATPVKTAPIDTVVFIDDAVSDELITDLLFEDVGGQELLTIARSDTVNGQEVIYQPFKNLNILQETYNPTNLLLLQETSDKIFSNFIIDLREKIPKVGSGINGKNFYVDAATGDLTLEFVNLKSDEQIEVQISTAGIIDEAGI